MRKLLAIVLLAIAGSALGQSGNFPALVGQRGTTLPTNCTIGQLFFDTDATAGGNIYGCTAANTWTQMEGGSAITGCTYAANVLTCPTITATTKFLAANGSAAAPAYTFSSDTTTGIYGTAGSVLGFSTGGTFRAIMGTGAFVLADTYGFGWNTDTRLTRYAAKQLMISGDGTGATTNAGWIVGYLGVSGYGALWNSGVTPSTTNYVLTSSAAGNTYINGTAADAVGILASGVEKAVFYSTSGRGMSLTAGTATTAVSPLSITQTWNAAGVSFPGLTLTVTDTASAAGSYLMAIRGGASGTSDYMLLTKGGILQLNANTPTTTILRFGTANTGLAHNAGGDNPIMLSNGNDIATWTNGFFKATSTVHIGWSSGSSGTTSADTSLNRVAAGIVGVRNASTGGAALSFVEQTAPSAPSANGAYIYAQDNGSGKTQLCALFNTGAAQCFATEP